MIVEKEAKRDAEREEMAKIDRGLWPLGPSKISKAGLMPHNSVCKKSRTGHHIYRKDTYIWRNSFKLIFKIKN